MPRRAATRAPTAPLPCRSFARAAAVAGGAVCPFPTDAVGNVAVQLMQPFVRLLGVVLVWLLQRALLRLLGALALQGRMWALRAWLLLRRGSARSGLVRACSCVPR
jgi:hypothetical protein